MKNILILIVLFYVYSCSSNKSAEQYWNDAKKFRVEENSMEAISNYKDLIKFYPDNNLAANSQFQIADIYLNDIKDYDYSIDEFKKVIYNYDGHDVAKKSLFMIAYIYNNYLDAYTDAINNYELFLKTYPNDELAPSVKYELEGLEDINSSIKSLIINK